MKYRIFIFMIVCTALLMTGCGNKEPLAPDSKDLALNEQEVSLAKKPHIKITPWEGVEKRIEVADPGEEWISDDGIMHVRGRVYIDKIESKNHRIAGIITVTGSYDLNLATGNGYYFSNWSLAPHTVKGTWEGKLVAEFKNFIFAGFGAGKGTGKLEGMKLTVEIHETPSPYTECPESGYIIEKK